MAATDDAQDQDQDPVDVIDGTVLKWTSDGEELAATVVHGSKIELRPSGAMPGQLTAGELLNYLKRGEVYLPTHPSGFQDALRELADHNA